MDSTLIAYVAEALEDMDPGIDYDTAAARAAELLGKSKTLRAVARAYGAGQAGTADLHLAVGHALRRY